MEPSTEEPAALGDDDDLASDVSSEDDGIRIVLHQPDELDDEGEEGLYGVGDGGDGSIMGMDGDTTMAMAGSIGGVGGQPQMIAASASACSAGSIGSGATPAGASSRHKEWVNPRLAAAAGAGASPAGAMGATPPPKQPAITAAQRAKLGPLVHVPGGLQMSLEGPMPENIDIDQLAEKPWHKPDVDPTDYFNYGFSEDTWRLYCKRQQEIRAEARKLQQMQVPTFDAAMMGGGMAGGMGAMGGGMGGGMGGHMPGMGGGGMGGGGMGGLGGGVDAGISNDPASLKTPRDNNGLLNMLDALTGGNVEHELPLAALQEVTKHVATLSRKAAPKLIQQKRAFVRGWHDEQKRLANAGAMGGQMPTGGGSPEKAMLLANVTPEGVFAEVDARLAAAQRSITQSELAESHVDALSEQIATLLNIPVPTMMRDRRDLISKWHAQYRRQRASGREPMGRPMPQMMGGRR